MRQYRDTTMASFSRLRNGAASALLTALAVATMAGWASPDASASANHGRTSQVSGTTGPIYSAIHRECLDYYARYGSYQAGQTRFFLDYGYDAGYTSRQLVAGIHHCTGKSAQKWTLPADNTIRIAGKCLTATKKTSGSGIVLATCNKSGSQFWEANGIVRVAGVELINPRSGKCLTDPNGSTIDGTQVRLYACKRSAAQTWYLPPTKP